MVNPAQVFRATIAFLMAMATTILPSAVQTAMSATPDGSQAAQEWLEPRGMSAINLVGLVPEEQLQGASVGFNGGVGTLTYLYGERVGDLVTVRVNVTPRYVSGGNMVIGCMGHAGYSDHWAVTAPASEMRLFSHGQDISDRVYGLHYYGAGKLQPTWGTEGVSGRPETYARYERYWVRDRPVRNNEGALKIPANMGCILFVSGRADGLEAEFVHRFHSKISVETLGSEQFTFHSYIGVGNADALDSLRGQMGRRFGNRHDKFPLSPPPGTEYVLVVFPQTPVNPYPLGEDDNIWLSASGTYRLADGPGDLGSDHDVSALLPLQTQWLDADLSGGKYLTPLSKVTMISSPEYFVPTGVEYDPCMREGGCPNSLLDKIYAAEMTMKVYYYSVDRIAHGLERIPLRAVGPNWRPDQVGAATVTPEKPVGTGLLPDAQSYLYLPAVAIAPPPPSPPPPPPAVPSALLPPDDPEDCPCGWFDEDGQMLDIINRR